jgi:hypothetical protein
MKKLCPVKKILLPFDFVVAGATGFSAAASVPTKQVQGKPIVKVARNTVMRFIIFISFFIAIVVNDSLYR